MKIGSTAPTAPRKTAFTMLKEQVLEELTNPEIFTVPELANSVPRKHPIGPQEWESVILNACVELHDEGLVTLHRNTSPNAVYLTTKGLDMLWQM